MIIESFHRTCNNLNYSFRQARKALRALKGIVKLQAIIRGRNVRRQAMTTLKCLQSIVNIQSQVCAKRIQMVEGAWTCSENKQLENLSDKIIKVGIEDLCCHLSNPINTKHLSILSLCHHFNSIWAQINNPNSMLKLSGLCYDI